MNEHIWHIIAHAGDADTFEPAISPGEPRLHVGLRRQGDPYGLGPDVIREISEKAGARPAEAAADLISIASAAFAADLRVRRDIEADRWTRRLRLYVPVAEPSLWQPAAQRIARFLGFLTGDIWELELRQRVDIAAPDVGKIAPQVETVCLFSGGLDSLVAGIDLLSTGASVALVGHYGAGMASPIQERVLAPMGKRYGAKMHSFRFYVQPPKDYDSGETSMRSRSVLFLALGVGVASALKAKKLVVGENGLISLNVPLTLARLGSHSTRTTHPHVMEELREILLAVGLDIDVELPYRFLTKGEMLLRTQDPKLLAEVAPLTMSCSHPEVGRYRGNTPGKHCGYCVPCVIRRAALLRASLPHDSYEIDVLSAPPPPDSDTSRDLRAFSMAFERFKKMTPTGRTAAVLSTGPLPPQDVQRYVGAYVQGMGEVGAFLSCMPLP